MVYKLDYSCNESTTYVFLLKINYHLFHNIMNKFNNNLNDDLSILKSI